MVSLQFVPEGDYCHNAKKYVEGGFNLKGVPPSDYTCAGMDRHSLGLEPFCNQYFATNFNKCITQKRVEHFCDKYFASYQRMLNTKDVQVNLNAL